MGSACCRARCRCIWTARPSACRSTSERSGPGRCHPGYAADDGAAIVYRGTRLAECVASRAGARVVRIEADGSVGRCAASSRCGCCPEPSAAPRDEPIHEPYGVSELRALRAGRHRWD